MNSAKSGGFTLIELLIVVAIIAILAAIAVPNFLEAQTRSKVSRVRNDLRVLATALESYRVDWNKYPKGTEFQWSVADPAVVAAIGEQARVLERLSTPVAYLTTAALVDPFNPNIQADPSKTANSPYTSEIPQTGVELQLASYYKYSAFTPGEGAFVTALVERPTTNAKWAWAVWSSGPERKYISLRGTNLLASAPFGAPQVGAVSDVVYDPTNGTVSKGNIFRLGGVRTGEGSAGDIFITTMLQLQK